MLEPGRISSFATYVIDVEGGQMYAIDVGRPDPQSGYLPLAFAGWIEDGTLLIAGPAGAYEVTLDGRITPTRIAPTPTADVSAERTSADGLWRAMPTGDALIVESSDATVRYRLTGASIEWAPAGHFGAFRTSICGLYLFDPDAGTLSKLTQSDSFVLESLWHPNGKLITANLTASNAGIALFPADGTPWYWLVPLAGGGELSPLGWSPSGRHLAFRYRGGRDFGCGEPVYIPPSLECLR